MKGRVSIKLESLMIKPTHRKCVNLRYKKMKLKIEIKIKSQGSNNKKLQSFGGV